jgi:RNA polymerase sigma-70 factor (ECF subfamily)
MPPTPATAERALGELVASEGPRLYGLARRLCGDPADAEDLVQETLLNAYRSWHQLADKESPRPWLYAIARRACQRMRRPRAGAPARFESLESLDALLPRPGISVPDLAAVAEGPHADRLRTEAREIVERALEALPERFRLPLVLADIAELQSAEIAEVLGLQEATVKTRIHRARLKLREALSGALPQRPVPPIEHSRRVCLDLLQAKLAAYDRRAPFPYSQEALCERCRTVLGTLDLSSDLCAALGRVELPVDLRRRLLATLS